MCFFFCRCQCFSAWILTAESGEFVVRSTKKIIVLHLLCLWFQVPPAHDIYRDLHPTLKLNETETSVRFFLIYMKNKFNTLNIQSPLLICKYYCYYFYSFLKHFYKRNFLHMICIIFFVCRNCWIACLSRIGFWRSGKPWYIGCDWTRYFEFLHFIRKLKKKSTH